MRIACYLEPTKFKADKWMRVFAHGCGGHIVRRAKEPDPTASDHVVMGTWSVARTLIPAFVRDDMRFWYLDSSYIRGPDASYPRYLRVERGRFWPVLQGGFELDRALSMGVSIRPWRHDGRYVLVALHGPKFGRPWSIDIMEWNATIEDRIKAVTDREIVIRHKPSNPTAIRKAPPIEEQLDEAWCVITHSSTLAVQAALAGVPVFCEPTCPAAQVGCTDLSRIEAPLRPDREEWIAELAWHQWSYEEMRSGKAWAYLRDEQ